VHDSAVTSGEGSRPLGSTIAVIIADGHRPFREGVRASLGGDFSIVGEAETVEELRLSTETALADVVLLDEDLPGGGLVAALEVAPPTARIVVFAQKPNDAHVIEALRLGVSGYLLKSIPGERLGETLRAVMGGEPALDRSLLGALVDEIARGYGRPHLSLPGGERVVLTRREQDVAGLLKTRLTTREIAAELGVSAVTVRRHISEIMRKLRVAKRRALIDALGE
jgi:two-component system, NarL family, nitrate/nitrite response regulator NarL